MVEQDKNQNQKINPNSIPINPLEVAEVKPLATLQSQSSENLDCKYCKFAVKDSFYFCPNCGKKIKEPPFKFSLLRTLGLIIFSALFPPLGLIPGIKNLFKKELSAKIIGIILIIVSIVATTAFIWFIFKMYNDMTRFYVDLYSQQGGKNYYEDVTPENVYKQLNSLQQMSR